MGRKKFEKSFLVIAHRGASYDAPENTMAAFRDAKRMGADMIELDVQLSGDGVSVVFHDETLDKKTNGAGRISEYNLRDLQKLDAGSWFSHRYAGEKIPTLEEVLKWTNGKLPLNIEIKPKSVTGDQDNGIEQKVADLVRDLHLENNVLISSFDYSVVGRAKELLPDTATGLLYNPDSPEKGAFPELVRRYKADFFHCHMRQINKKKAAALKEAGIPFFVYTVNSRRRMKKMIGLGASGLFTDKPGLLRYIVRNNKRMD